MLFIRGAPVGLRVPGAIAGRLRRELNGVDLCHRVGPGLQPQARIVKITDRQRVRFPVGLGSDAEPPEIQARLELDAIFLYFAENNTAATVLRQPSNHYSNAAFRFGNS